MKVKDIRLYKVRNYWLQGVFFVFSPEKSLFFDLKCGLYKFCMYFRLEKSIFVCYNNLKE